MNYILSLILIFLLIFSLIACNPTETQYHESDTQSILSNTEESKYSGETTGSQDDQTPGGDNGDQGGETPGDDNGDQGDQTPGGDSGDQGDQTPGGDSGDQGDQTPGGDSGDQGDQTPGGDSGDREDQGDQGEQKPDQKIVLNEISYPVSLATPITTEYLSAARNAYPGADYTSSIISNYRTSANDFNDRPRFLSLSFSGIESATSYVLELSRNTNFTTDVNRFVLDKDTTAVNVTNLYTGTDYFWRVTAINSDGTHTVSDVSHFATAKDSVRWIYVDGVRNVRDMGGWTGLKQGMVYRGSELNLVGNHGLQITDAGRKVMLEELGIKTDLDFRAAAENGSLSSPIGDDVYWCNQPIGNFLSAFDGSYLPVLKQFADPNNYPIYMHCWGGADRTGTVALILEGLCGVSEEDIAIDLEMTSFSIFGYRYRYDNSSFLFASTMNKIKSDYEGDTLKEKFENYALDLGLTRAEITNIQSLLSGSGATFDEDSRKNIFIDPNAQNITIGLDLANGQTVSSVCLKGISIPFRFENGTLILSAQVPASVGVSEGILTVKLSDGQELTAYFTSTPELTLPEKIAGGDLKLLFKDSLATYENGVVKKATGNLIFLHDSLRALYDAGYTSISFDVSAYLTGPVTDGSNRMRLVARWNSGSTYLTSDKQDLVSDPAKAPDTVQGTITIHLTEEHLGTDYNFVLLPQSGKNLILSNFSFNK